MSWVAVAVAGSAVIGAGASAYGANKQSKDNAHAQDQNLSAQASQNNAAWANWLMSRGIAPTTPVDAGVMPGSGAYQSVNTRLPLWANVNVSAPSATGGWLRRKDAAPTIDPRIVDLPTVAPTSVAPSAAPEIPGRTETIAKTLGFLNPNLGSKKHLDPLGIFG